MAETARRADTDDADRPRRRRTPAAVKDGGEAFPKRVSLALTEEAFRALNLAKLDDGVNVANRLRAMVDLWETNSRWKSAIDRHAPRVAEGASKYPKRITLPLTEEAFRALNLAKLDDGVNVVKRLRAMVDLWGTNSRWKNAANRHARQL